jgi:hypothetical protein
MEVGELTRDGLIDLSDAELEQWLLLLGDEFSERQREARLVGEALEGRESD